MAGNIVLIGFALIFIGAALIFIGAFLSTKNWAYLFMLIVILLFLGFAILDKPDTKQPDSSKTDMQP